MSINSTSPNYSTTVIPPDSEKTVSGTANAVEGQTENSSQAPEASSPTHHRHHHHKHHHRHHKHHGGQTNPEGGRSFSGTIPPPPAEMGG